MANTKKYVSLDKLGLYDEKIKKYLADADADVLQGAKDYADGLASDYEVAGAAAKALDDAKAYADAEDAKVEALVATAQAQADKGVQDAATAQAAAEAAQDSANTAQGEVDALETFVGTLPSGVTATTIVGYVQEKTAGIATEGAMTELAGRVKAIEDDYLVADDKNTLQLAIDGVQDDLNAEIERAKGIEGGLETRLAAVEGDYLKAADKTELQGNIDTVANALEVLTEGVDAEKVDGVKDLIDYVEKHGVAFTGVQEDIAENAEAIEGVAGRMTTAEGKITALEGAVATKAEQTALDEAIEALEGADDAQVERIAALEAKFTGEGETVEGMIATAKQEAIDAAAEAAEAADEVALAAAKKYADDEDAKIESRVDALEAASATHALAADLTALVGRVTTAEGEIDTLQSEMDAVEAKAAANETAIGQNAAAIALKADQTALTAVSDRVTDIETWHANFVEVSEEEINALFA